MIYIIRIYSLNFSAATHVGNQCLGNSNLAKKNSLSPNNNQVPTDMVESLYHQQSPNILVALDNETWNMYFHCQAF